MNVDCQIWGTRSEAATATAVDTNSTTRHTGNTYTPCLGGTLLSGLWMQWVNANVEFFCSSFSSRRTWQKDINQCCGSWMFIPDPGYYFYPSRIPDLGSRIPDLGSRIPDLGSRIPDPKTATKERGGENLLSYLFCSHKILKIKNYFIFEMLKEKNLGKFSKNYGIFYPKSCH